MKQKNNKINPWIFVGIAVVILVVSSVFWLNYGNITGEAMKIESIKKSTLITDQEEELNKLKEKLPQDITTTTFLYDGKGFNLSLDKFYVMETTRKTNQVGLVIVATDCFDATAKHQGGKYFSDPKKNKHFAALSGTCWTDYANYLKDDVAIEFGGAKTGTSVGANGTPLNYACWFMVKKNEINKVFTFKSTVICASSD